MCIEPKLQALDSEHLQLRSANQEDDARFDIRATIFWYRGQEAFFDIRVFHSSAPTYHSKKLTALHKLHEEIKKREYGERVREIEQGAFTLLVLFTTGGMAKESTTFCKRHADKLS